MAPMALGRSNERRECRKAEVDFNPAIFREICALPAALSKTIRIVTSSPLELRPTRKKRGPQAARIVSPAQPPGQVSERTVARANGSFLLPIVAERP